ncbi:MAG: NAD-dependent epimerase/dehydratase family protein [Arenimonas sp.]
MNSLIVGGGGFLGKNLTDFLLSKGEAVRIFERNGYQQETFPGIEKVDWASGDFFNPDDIRPSLEGIDVVFLMSSTTTPKTSNDNFIHDIQTNLVNTVRFLEIASQSDIRKIVFTSSGGTVYGVPGPMPIREDQPTHPICSYGINKLAIEKYLALFEKLHGLEYSVLRISNAYGHYQPANTGQGLVATFLNKMLCDEEIEIWGDGSVVRDYIYAQDVASALYYAATKNVSERIFNIGSGIGYSVNEILFQMEALLGKKAKTRHFDSRLIDVPKNILDISSARVHLGWEPSFNMQNGLKATADWLSSQSDLVKK